MTVADFWDMTPRETSMAMEASAWRMQQEQARMVNLAWHIAALSRAKRLPPLSRLLNPLKPRKHEPIEKRRSEFEELKERMKPRTRST